MNSTITQYLLESVHSIFEEAFNISTHEIAHPLENGDSLLYAKIGITDDIQTKEIIIGMPKEGLTFLSGIYFGADEDFSDEELEDFIKEVSNLIVGRVKVTYSSSNKKTTLEIPKIVTLKDENNYTIKYFQVKNTYIVLAY